jgi:hypothetical protein
LKPTIPWNARIMRRWIKDKWPACERNQNLSML